VDRRRPLDRCSDIPQDCQGRKLSSRCMGRRPACHVGAASVAPRPDLPFGTGPNELRPFIQGHRHEEAARDLSSPQRHGRSADRENLRIMRGNDNSSSRMPLFCASHQRAASLRVEVLIRLVHDNRW